MSDLATDVLIVGAGPVGLALAGDLGWRGVDCVVIEQSDGSIHQPRQDLVGIRTMEFCRRWGIVDDVEAAPYPRDYPQDNIYVAGSLAEGWEIGRHRSPSMGESEPPPVSPQKRERCPQNMFDPILTKFARSFDTVEVRYRHRFTAVKQEDERVIVTVEDLEASSSLDIEARYLVGCDGAGSTVREAAGIRMEGEAVLTYTTNIIFRCDGFEALHGIPRGYRFIFLDTMGTWATIVAINGRDQWRMSIIGDRHNRQELSTEDVDAAIRRAVGRDFGYEILTIVPWTRRELVADRFANGRVFVAGDAAHCMSPTGGFGMNTGVGDAIDLSWKLSAMLQGWGGDRLLGAYDTERRPIGWRNVRESSGNLKRMLTPRDEPELLERSPAGDKARERTGADFSALMQREWNTLGIHLGYRYEDSPICWPDGTPAPPYDVMTYDPSARPGARAPHVWLDGGRSTLDLFGKAFVLLRFGPDAPDPAPLRQAASKSGLPLDVVALREPDAFATYEKTLVLIRPDGHVAWRGDVLPDDCGALVDRVCGA